MKVVNKIADENYVQWIEKFTIDVLNFAGMEYEELIIDDIEPSRRIFIFVDSEEYTIRTWNYYAVEYDNDDNPCSEIVEYTLYKIVEDDDGSHGESVDDGRIKIEWLNDMQ